MGVANDKIAEYLHTFTDGRNRHTPSFTTVSPAAGLMAKLFHMPSEGKENFKLVKSLTHKKASFWKKLPYGNFPYKGYCTKEELEKLKQTKPDISFVTKAFDVKYSKIQYNEVKAIDVIASRDCYKQFFKSDFVTMYEKFENKEKLDPWISRRIVRIKSQILKMIATEEFCNYLNNHIIFVDGYDIVQDAKALAIEINGGAITSETEEEKQSERYAGAVEEAQVLIQPKFEESKQEDPEVLAKMKIKKKDETHLEEQDQ